MKKLILQCGLSPGDIVMLTAAVRDLHRCYPGQFVTDVRTVCPDLWENNPYITALSDVDPEAAYIKCAIPLINNCNKTPYHCLHGFIDFLNGRLNLSIKPTVFKGDIHLSEQEKAWHSQVHEVTGEDTPFWIIAGGGKHDVTIKWWQSERYQKVVDQLWGRIQFVQIGQSGHYHPKLNRVIDLRGRTNLRELIRLIYHSQGVLCSVTVLMHLAAAVETKRGRPLNRPCVVVAGGREPAHWEAYPGHQFIHTNGALPCCAKGGCWKDRIARLRDGDKRDRPGSLCVDVVDGLPHCMDMITPAEVVRRIETYFKGGVLAPLAPRQRTASERGIAATAENPFDQQALNLHYAGMACDRSIKTIRPYPNHYEGRGIVICGGGIRYFTNAWVCLNMLRRLRCQLPVELWHLGPGEMDEDMKALLAPLGVELRDAHEVRKRFPCRKLNGWELKPYAIIHSRFRDVMLLDADNVPVVNPEFLFDTTQFRQSGAIFWPDFLRGKSEKALAVWRSCGLRMPDELEFETGQIVVNKECCWQALCLSLWFNENSDFYYQYVHGDKETFHLAFRKLKKSYSLVPKPIHALDGTMCHHDFDGRRIFQHRNMSKWDLFFNKRIRDFWFERECLDDIAKLRGLWDGGMKARIGVEIIDRSNGNGKAPRIETVMISCPERNSVRCRTLENLNRTDWGDMPIHLQIDDGSGDDHIGRQVRCAYSALKRCLGRPADYILFLEDDLDFNKRIRYNLRHWAPLRERAVTLASLYNPHLREMACDTVRNARIVHPNHVFGSQAFIISMDTLKYLLRRWHTVRGAQDIKISRLAGHLKKPILYHAPSLVQHAGTRSTWNGGFHQAMDFDPEWTAQPLR